MAPRSDTAADGGIRPPAPGPAAAEGDSRTPPGVPQTAAATGEEVSRRGLLRTAAVTGILAVSGAGLAACAGPASPTAGPGSSRPPGGAGQAGGTSLGAAAQIPVGGGKVFADRRVVVTQPTPGTFKAFSTTCTHMGCQVDGVSGGRIHCPCHGSQYSIVDGSVLAGPAPRPLPAEPVTVRNGQIILDGHGGG